MAIEEKGRVCVARRIGSKVKFFYDTEFIDDGKTIDLISIGIVGEDDREYYAVNACVDERKILNHHWLPENVWPYLPQTFIYSYRLGNGTRVIPTLDRTHDSVKPINAIASEVARFLLGEDYENQTEAPTVELYGWCCGYDHVVLAQLWGPLTNAPIGIPYLTYDIKYLCHTMGNPRIPKQEGNEHHALHDAKWNKYAYDYLCDAGWME